MELNVRKKKKQQTEYKHRVIPMLVALLLLSLVFWNHLQKELKFPAADWSRSLELPNKSGEYMPFLDKKDGYTLVYTAGQSGAQKLELDKNLDVVSKAKAKAALDENARVWSDGKQFVSTSNKQLVLLKDGQKKVLAENVSLMAPSKNTVYYASDNNLLAYLPETEKTITLKTFAAPVSHLTGSMHSDSAIATVTADEDQTVHYAAKKEDSFSLTTVLSFKRLSSETLVSVKFAETDSELHVIYTKYSTAGGSRNYFPFYGHAPFEKLEDMPFTNINFFDKQGSILDKPTHMEMFIKNDTPHVLFASRGMLTSKKGSVSIYTAQPEKGVWKAERISSTDNFNRSPATFDGENIFWLRGVSDSGNQLYAASSDPAIKAESKQINKQDMLNAGSNTLSSLLISFFSIAVAMLWILPTILFFLVVYLFNKRSFEEEKPWVFWAFAIPFAAAQTYGIQTLFNAHFYQTAPGYLTFTNSSYVLPVMVAALSLLTLRAAIGKDWTLVQRTAFFTGMNLMMIMLLIGVYVY